MEKLQDLGKYFSRLESALKKGEKFYDSNSDRAHNAKIMQLIFLNCTKVQMFCGSLSIFRNKFQYHLEKDYGVNDAEEIMSNFHDSFRSFLNREGTQLSIIVENFEEVIPTELFDEELFKSNIRSEKIYLRKLGDDFAEKTELNHYTIGDNTILRFENDKSVHNGICGVNDSQLCQSAQNNFNMLLKFAETASFS